MKKSKTKKILWKEDWTTQEWEEQRANLEGIGLDYVRIGASDIGHILFSSKWKCKRRLAYHLIEGYNSFEITETTLEGHLQEPLTVDRWESWDADPLVAMKQVQNGVKVRRLEKAKFFLVSENYKNFFVSLDYIPADNEQFSPFSGELYPPMMPVEVKFTNKQYYTNYWNYKDLPITPQYYCQVQAQMLLTNTSICLFLVKIGDDVNRRFVPIEIARDDEFITTMIEAVDEYVELILNCKTAYYRYLLCTDEVEKETLRQIYEDMLPPYGGSEDDVNLADERWLPPIDPDADYLIGDEEIDEMMSSYMHFGEVENMCKEEKNKIKANLKHLSSGFQGIKTANYKAIIRGQRSDKKAYFGVSVNKPI